MLEQPYEAARDRPVARQRVLHIGLAEGRTGLAQHLAIEPQDGGLADRQPGGENQPVEPVILDGAGPHRAQRFLETPAQSGGGRGRHGTGLTNGPERQFVDPHRAVVRAVDAERLLGDDAQPEIFEDRQHVRQGHRFALAVEPETRSGGTTAIRPIAMWPSAIWARMQRGFERRAGEHRLDRVEVGDRLGGVGARLIGDRERLQPAQPGAGRGLAERGGGCLRDPVGPAAPGLGETLFERGRIDRRHRAAGDIDDELHARQHRLVEMRVEIRDRAGERRREDRGKALAQPCVVALARDIDEAGDKAFERVLAHEQRDALALLQVEDADRGVEQFVLGDLEQFVAREGFEDMEQGLAVVALRGKARALDRAPHLLPQQRDRVWPPTVGNRGEEADEQPQRHNFAHRIEAPDADRIHVDGAVHGGALLGLDDDQEFAAADEFLDMRRQPGEVTQPAEDRIAHLAENAERRDCLPIELPRGAGEEVFAKPEIGEIVVVEPAQKIDDFGDVARRQLCPRRRRLVDRLTGAQFTGDRLQGAAHRRPVRHRAAHVGEHAVEPGSQRRARRRVRLARDRDLHPGFAQAPRRRVEPDETPRAVACRDEDRVDHEPHLAPALIERCGQRIDKKRHVVVDDLDDGIRRRPAIRRALGVIDAQFGAAAPALRRQTPQRQRGAAQIGRVARGNVIRRHMLVEFGDEAVQQRALARLGSVFGQGWVGQVLVHPALSGADECRLLCLDRARHGSHPSRRRESHLPAATGQAVSAELANCPANCRCLRG